MRVRRHRRLAGLLSLVHKLLRQFDEQLRDRVDLRPHVQPQVGRNLLIAAAAGVQLEAHLAGNFHQPLLDIVVHVLDGRIVGGGNPLSRDLIERLRASATARHCRARPPCASAAACALLAATSYGTRMRSNGNDRCHCSKSAFSSWLKRPDHIFTSLPRSSGESAHANARAVPGCE